MKIVKDAYNLEGFTAKLELLKHQRTLCKVKGLIFHPSKVLELTKLEQDGRN